MTFCIAAVDDRGFAGVACMSLVLAVGARVPFVERGVGAVGLLAGTSAAMASAVVGALGGGKPSREALALVQSLDHDGVAHLAVVDMSGNAATYSGAHLESFAEGFEEPGVASAANLMEHSGVPMAAVAAFHQRMGAALSVRLLDALMEAERLGGDIRGRQSVALRVVGPPTRGELGVVDLRVDDARDPVGELARLHRIATAHSLLETACDETGLYANFEVALKAHRMAPEDPTSLGAALLAALRQERWNDAALLYLELERREPRIRRRLERLVGAGKLVPGVLAHLPGGTAAPAAESPRRRG